MLASFEVKTPHAGPNPGHVFFKEYRQLLIQERSGDDHLSLSKRAYSDILQPWFRKAYPESELLSFILFETIASEDEVEKESRLHQIKWCEPDEGASNFYFWVGASPKDPSSEDRLFGMGATKADAALDFVEKFMVHQDYMVIQFDHVKTKK